MRGGLWHWCAVRRDWRSHPADARHRQTWRRFESCSTLEELLLFARSLPCTPLGKLQLVNVTMSPHVTLDLQSQLGLTLQRLDLWPAGHIRVQAA